MSLFDPFDATTRLRCACGAHATHAEHEAARAASPDTTVTAAAPGATAAADPAPAAGIEPMNRRVLESAVMRAIFPDDAERRAFLRAVGRRTAYAAVSSIVPFGALEALAQDKQGPLEKTDLKIGFVPITCASPLIMAEPLGFYRKQGLNVTMMKAAGWALVRDKVMNREFDASHMLAPMPLAISIGAGSTAMPINVATIQNINGQAIVLANKHKANRDPKNWKGFKFAIPFDYSIHNLLLRYYLAEHGIHPDTDVQLRVTPPPEMVANLRAGNIDGFLGPDPINQRAVYDEIGFIHVLSREIWDGHPCCSFGVPAQFVKENPNTFAALYRAILNAAAMARDPKNRPVMAEVLSPPAYLNQPKAVVEQVLTGTFADGLGNVRKVPERVDYDPYPWYSMAVWILSQLKRWGYLKGEVRYQDIAERVYLLTDARKRMAEVGMSVPKESYRRFKVMGKEFDWAQADAYVDSFAIRKAG